MLKKFLAIVTSVIILVTSSVSSVFFVNAEQQPNYPYTIFGRNGITMNGQSISVNGNVATNKFFSSNLTPQRRNINGTFVEGQGVTERIKHVYIDEKIKTKYFTENYDLSETAYVREDMNINLGKSLFSRSDITLTGNTNANNCSLGSLTDISISGESLNLNTSAIYSKYGNITISTGNSLALTGLFYAPLGTLTINSRGVNLNNAIIIADKIVINCIDSINVNTGNELLKLIGTESELYDFNDMRYLPESWLVDSDEDLIIDLCELVVDTEPFIADTDEDLLPDGYEMLITKTDPLHTDTDSNGISDADEDFDADKLTNYEEYVNDTNPYKADTDDDGLTDSDEINVYTTDPKDEDTDDDTLLDGDEIALNSKYKLEGNQSLDPKDPISDKVTGDQYRKFDQTVTVDVKSADEVINGITVDIDNIPGYLDNAISVESVMGIDAMSSEVVGLMGEPYDFSVSNPELEPSENSPATLTFNVNKGKVDKETFGNLLVFWFDEENKRYEKMPTNHNWGDGKISTETTHFSEYMLVDERKWDEVWEKCLKDITSERNSAIALVLDFSSGVGSPSYQPGGYAELDRQYAILSNRIELCRSVIENMPKNNSAALIVDQNGEVLCGLTSLKSVLFNVLNTIEDDINDGEITASGIIYNTGVSNSNAVEAVNTAEDFLSNISPDKFKKVIYIGDAQDVSDIDLAGAVKKSGVEFYAYGSGNVDKNTDVDNVNYINLNKLASAFGGKVIQFADGLIGGEINYTEKYFNLTDSDDDGIPNVVEKYGLKFNGRSISTNPNKVDTDDDTLKDGYELKFAYSKEEAIKNYEQYISNLITLSNPTLQDTDFDGLRDDEEDRLNTNPRIVTKYCRYDKNKAVEYALKWYKDYNNEYDNFDGSFGVTVDQTLRLSSKFDSSDCTNFTSQCLYAGGITMTENWHSYKEGIMPSINSIIVGLAYPNLLQYIIPAYIVGGSIKYDHTYAWCRVRYQLPFFDKDRYSEGVEIITKENLDEITVSGRVEIGDLMYFDNETDGDYSHSAIVSRVNEEEKICYAAHSDSYNYKSLNIYFNANPNGTIKIVKLKKVIVLE